MNGGRGRTKATLRAERGSRVADAGKCFLDMLGVFAEFETNLHRERQLEGRPLASQGPASFD